MEIIIKSINISLTSELKKYIEEKIGSLKKFLKIIKVFVEIGKPSERHKKGNIYYAECQISLPKKTLRAEAERENLKLAICEIKDELQRQIKKYKETKTIKQKSFSQFQKIKKKIKLSLPEL